MDLHTVSRYGQTAELAVIPNACCEGSAETVSRRPNRCIVGHRSVFHSLMFARFPHNPFKYQKMENDNKAMRAAVAAKGRDLRQLQAKVDVLPCVCFLL